MPNNDSAFKWLVSFRPQDYVDRFCPGARFVRLLPTELSREPLRADALIEVQPAKAKGNAPGNFALHFEVQTKADPTIPRRLCIYGLLAEQRDDLVVLSTVIYLEKCKTPTPPWRQIGPGGRVIHTFDYNVVRLWEEPVEDLLASGQVGLLPLFPFLKGATLAMLEPVAAALEQIPDPAARANSIYYTLAFAKRVFTPAAVNVFLRRSQMLDQFIKESPMYQEIIDQGAEQGELRTLRRSILHVVQRRFAPLFAVAEAHVTTLTDPDQLQAILDDLPYAPDEAAAKHILGLPA
jgi:predicted transposase YdaD